MASTQTSTSRTKNEIATDLFDLESGSSIEFGGSVTATRRGTEITVSTGSFKKTFYGEKAAAQVVASFARGPR